MNVLVTGGSGFIGRALCERLSQDHDVRVASRKKRDVAGRAREVVVGEIGSGTQWSQALRDVHAIVHLAGKAHVVESPTPEVRAEYQNVNVEGTRILAAAAARAGVRRFIYISSSKVHGDYTGPGRRLLESDDLTPQDLYAESKRDAEQALWGVARESGMELVILRPPLIYGPFVKANFLALLRIVDRGWPLPFGGVRNLRSLLYVENLVDALAKCLVHPDVSGRTYFLSDGAVSIGDLIRKLARGLGRPARLISVPEGMLRAAGAMVGKSGAIDRLTSSFVIDDRAIRSEMGWSSPYSMDEGIRATCDWYRTRRESGGVTA
jgi:nucleoside-diphosphate-sugar epimerase